MGSQIQVRDLLVLQDVPGLAPPGASPAQLWHELQSPLWSRVIAPAGAIGVAVPFVGVLPIPAGPIVQRTPTGAFFFVSSYLDDPGLRVDGRIAIPRRELAHLTDLQAAGVGVDEVWIGHELPVSWRPGDPMPGLVPSPPRYRELDEELERIITKSATTLANAARLGARAILGAGAIAAGIATTVGADPIILGGIRHPSQPVAAWVVLASWTWE